MNAKQVCDRIRGIRNEKRITQEKLALKLGISARAYNYKENNKVNFTIDELYTIASILGCNITDFFSKDM